MNYYDTRDDAIAAGLDNPKAQYVLRITHRDKGTVYINSPYPLLAWRIAYRKNPQLKNEVVSADAEVSDLASIRIKQANDELEKAIPGLNALRNACREADIERELEERAFERGMRDGVMKRPGRTARDRFAAMLKENTRAALWLRADRQEIYTHWSDPTGKAASAKKAKELLQSGATEAEALAALQMRVETSLDRENNWTDGPEVKSVTSQKPKIKP